MDDDSNVQIKQKGQRKSKKEEPVDEPEHEEVDVVEDVEEEEEEEEAPAEEEPKKKAPAKKAPAKKVPAKAKKVDKVDIEEYDVSQGPDVIIHKRHKGAKPRKIIVITGDSDLDESDEELPYRAKPKIEVKKRAAAPAPEPKAKPAPKPAAPPKKQNVGLIGGKPQVVDSGKGIPQRYHQEATAKKTGFVVDQYIDSLLGL